MRASESVTVPQNQRIVELRCVLFNGCGPQNGSGAVHAFDVLEFVDKLGWNRDVTSEIHYSIKRKVTP